MAGVKMNLFKLSDETEKCRERLEAILSHCSRVAIAFSGGVDSTLLLEAAYRNKNPEILAVIVKSQLNPQSETDAAVEFLSLRNISYILIETDILAQKKISSNPHDRCYHCKKYIFTLIRKAAEEKGFTLILDGTHSEDLDDYRPGLKALAELKILSPLKEAGFKKANIRELARYYDLKNWSLDASPCLATRIPFGTAIKKEDLIKIEKGESFIRENGFPVVRLRIHCNVARIEIPADKFNMLTDAALRRQITDYIKSLGFDFAAIDLEGYRTGSMNLRR
jgi:uncharacterized protein